VGRTTVSTKANQSVDRIPFTTTETQMTVRVYSPRAGIPVRLKVEDAADPTHSVETEALTTKVNAWETLTFNFANPVSGTAALNLAYTYNKVSIFFDFARPEPRVAAARSTSTTWRLAVAGGGGSSSFTPITFDEAGVTYTLTGSAVPRTLRWWPTRPNASNKVAKVVKSATAELWAGTTVSTKANQSVDRIPFTTTETRMTVRVYSPRAGIPVRLKVEDAADPTHSVETEALTTKVNAWETLTFNFANPVSGTAALEPRLHIQQGVDLSSTSARPEPRVAAARSTSTTSRSTESHVVPSVRRRPAGRRCQSHPDVTASGWESVAYVASGHVGCKWILGGSSVSLTASSTRSARRRDSPVRFSSTTAEEPSTLRTRSPRCPGGMRRRARGAHQPHETREVPEVVVRALQRESVGRRVRVDRCAAEIADVVGAAPVIEQQVPVDPARPSSGSGR